MRPAFSHVATFMWFATVVFGMIVRSDALGVTSIVRGLNLRPKCYSSIMAETGGLLSFKGRNSVQ
jgi:hypothetical protein